MAPRVPPKAQTPTHNRLQHATQPCKDQQLPAPAPTFTWPTRGTTTSTHSPRHPSQAWWHGRHAPAPRTTQHVARTRGTDISTPQHAPHHSNRSAAVPIASAHDCKESGNGRPAGTLVAGTHVSTTRSRTRRVRASAACTPQHAPTHTDRQCRRHMVLSSASFFVSPRNGTHCLCAHVHFRCAAAGVQRTGRGARKQ